MHSGSRSTTSRRVLAAALWLFAVAATNAAQAPPSRIVSTAPSITETLFALDLGPHVVGVSTFCAYPPEVAKLPRVGTYLKPDAEAIARLKPDLVVLQKVSSELPGRLTALHIRYIDVPLGTLEDVYAEIRQIGAASGVDERGARLVSRMQATLERLRRQAATLPRPRVLLIVGRSLGTLQDLVAVGPSGYLDQLIAAAGGTNVLTGSHMPAYPRISLETVLRENPDVIIDLTGMEETEAEREQDRAETLALWHKRQELAAVRKGRVYSVSSSAFVVPGPRAVIAAELLFQYFHAAGPAR